MNSGSFPVQARSTQCSGSMIETGGRLQSCIFSELAAGLLQSGIGFRFQARGRSMLPSIQDGEILYVRAIAPRKLKAGEIVLFKSGGEFKAHRIVRKRGQRFITRGDAAMETDGEICGEQIVGRIFARQCEPSGPLVPLTGTRIRLKFFAKQICSRIRPLFGDPVLRPKNQEKSQGTINL